MACMLLLMPVCLASAGEYHDMGRVSHSTDYISRRLEIRCDHKVYISVGGCWVAVLPLLAFVFRPECRIVSSGLLSIYIDLNCTRQRMFDHEKVYTHMIHGLVCCTERLLCCLLETRQDSEVCFGCLCL